MTPAAPYPCKTEKEVATIIRINKIWHMLENKIHKELDILQEKREGYAEAFNAFAPITNKWQKFVRAQRRLAKQRNFIEYDYILGNVSITAFHKNSMVDLGTLSYPQDLKD